MARELWAKVAVEIIRDPKIICRAPWERWLWLGLICLTKEFGADGVLGGANVRTLCVTLDLRVAPKQVAAALNSFEKSGMIRRLSDDSVEIVNFKKRQFTRKDSPEAVAERQRRWRARRKGNGSVTGTVTDAVTGDITGPLRRNVTQVTHVEEEEEKDLAAAAFVVDRGTEKKSAAAGSFSGNSLAVFLSSTWPTIQNPAETANAWMAAFPRLDVLAESRAAHAKELADGEPIRTPGAFLQRWFERAESARATQSTTGASGPPREGTAEWDRAKQAADERARRDRERTKAILDAREKAFRESVK